LTPRPASSVDHRHLGSSERLDHVGQLGLGAHHRKQDDVPDGLDSAEEHDQPVDTDADPRRGGEGRTRAPDEGQVGRVGLEVAAGHGLGLAPEPLLLLLGDVELAVAVGELLGVDGQLEPVGHGGVVLVRRASGETSTGKPHTNTGSTTVGSRTVS
jgi:hypothetical protein